MPFDLSTAKKVTGVGDSAISNAPSSSSGFDINSAKTIQQGGEYLKANQIKGGEDILAENNAWLNNIATPDMISEWKDKGEIGMGEAYQRLDKWEMLPVLNGKTLIDDIAVVKSFNNFKEGKVLSPEDRDSIKSFVLDMAEVQARGYSIGGEIVDGALRMPAYIGEMALAVGITGLTLGAGAVPSFGGIAAKQGIKTAAKQGAKEFAKKVLKKGSQVAAVSAVGTSTVMLPRVAKKGYNDYLNDSIAVTDKGRLFFKEAERAPAEYALRAAATVFVENFAELAGGEVLRPVTRGAGKAVGKVLPKKFVDNFNKFLTATKSDKLRKAGFSGILEEMGEERIQDLLITSFDLDPDRGYSTEEFLDAMFPSKRDLLVEAGVISIVGGTSRAAVGLRNKLRSRGVSEAEVEQTVKNMSESEIDSSLETFKDMDSSSLESQLQTAEVELEALENFNFDNLEPADAEILQEQIDQKVLEVENLESVVGQRLREMDASGGKGGLPVPKRPETLAQFLKKKGGLKVDTGETEMLTRKEAPDLKGVANKNGKLSLDEARELAVESGFLEERGGEGVAQSDVQDVLDALISESQGSPVFRGEDVGTVVAREEILEFNSEVDKANAEISANAKELKTVRAAFRDGVSAAKKDVKAVQKTLKKAIDATRLSDANKKKFINRIIETQTAEQLEKKLPDIEKRVVSLLGGESVAKQKTTLKNELSRKRIKANIVSGKKTGKFDAATQVRLEELSEAFNLSGASSKGGVSVNRAQEELSKRLASEGAQDHLVNKILNIKANPNDVSADDVAEVIAEVKAIKIFGNIMAEDRLSKRRFEAADVRNTLINHLKELDPEAAARKQTGFKAGVRSIRQSVRSGISLIAGSWNELIDRVAPASMSNVLGVRREISKAKNVKRVMQEKIMNAADEVYETNGDMKKLTKELVDSDKIVSLGVFTDARGEKVSLELSRSQARKLLMASKSEEILEKTIMSDKGNAYTPEMLEASFSILNEKDYDFADAQLEIYADFYNDINEVYARVFGINLPKVEFYSPIAREADNGDVNDDVFLRDINRRRALATGSAIHIRNSDANSPLVLKTDLNAYASHVNEMANFIAFREKTMLLDSVFGSADLRKRIELTFGSSINSEIKDTMAAIAGVTRAENNAIERSINYLNRNFATSVLGLKAKIGLTQLASIPSYAEFIPVKDFVSGSADFFLNYKKAVSILSKSELMQDRGANEDLDIARMGKTFDNKFLKKVKDKKANLIDYTLIFTKFGDRAAIYMGGWAVYKHAINNGKTPEQAMAAFESATADTQQSKDIDQLSHFQRSNAVTRGLVMFMSAPIAQFRGELRVVRRYKKGEINKKQLMKGLIIYHVLIPQIYTALAGGIIAGEIDEEDQFRALMLGSLAGIPLIGDAINTAFRAIQGKANQPKEALKAMRSIVEAMNDAFDAFSEGLDGDFEEAMEALVDLSENAAKIVGVPVDGAKGIASGIEDISEGDTKKGALKLSGFPRSVSGK